MTTIEGINCKEKIAWVEMITPRIHMRRKDKKYRIKICGKEYVGGDTSDVVKKMEKDGWEITSWISRIGM